MEASIWWSPKTMWCDAHAHCPNTKTCSIQREKSLYLQKLMKQFLAYESGRNSPIWQPPGLYVIRPSALPPFLLSTPRGWQTHQGKVTWGNYVQTVQVTHSPSPPSFSLWTKLNFKSYIVEAEINVVFGGRQIGAWIKNTKPIK